MPKTKVITLTESAKAILTTWKNKLNLNVNLDGDSLDWVKNNHADIYDLIMKYDNVYTRKNHLSILQKMLRESGPKKLYEKYNKIFEALRSEIDNVKS